LLYKRITEQGTVGEPTGKPNPMFALPSTVNWMRALAILAGGVNFETGLKFYSGEGKRLMSPQEENTVLEQLFLALHHLSALEQMTAAGAPADMARVAVLAWYYGLYNAVSAMTAAQNGSFQEDHAGTALMWDTEFGAKGRLMEPFGWRVSSLIAATYKAEVAIIRSGSTSGLLTKPITASDARGAAAGYLSGTAAWYAWQNEEEVRRSTDFKALKVTDFRTKSARELRDRRLGSKTCGFLHQASRYRGKANYREALFLAYGKSTNSILAGYVADQAFVLRAFLAMAGAFASRRLGSAIWADFMADVDGQRAFTTTAASVWS
jgi:hypothetical protein